MSGSRVLIRRLACVAHDTACVVEPQLRQHRCRTLGLLSARRCFSSDEQPSGAEKVDAAAALRHSKRSQSPSNHEDRPVSNHSADNRVDGPAETHDATNRTTWASLHFTPNQASETGADTSAQTSTNFDFTPKQASETGADTSAQTRANFDFTPNQASEKGADTSAQTWANFDFRPKQASETGTGTSAQTWADFNFTPNQASETGVDGLAQTIPDFAPGQEGNIIADDAKPQQAIWAAREEELDALPPLPPMPNVPSRPTYTIGAALYILENRHKLYSLTKGADGTPEKPLKARKRKFKETLDIALRLGLDPRKGNQTLRGVVSLPHGTGKQVRVAVFAKGEDAERAREAGAHTVGDEDLLQQIKDGKLDFDKVVATPEMMPLVGKVARILGPRGLMPNAKLGSVTKDVVAALRAAKGGQVEFRAEKAGIVQACMGRMHFPREHLMENLRAFLMAIRQNKPEGAKGRYFKTGFLSTTMSPSVPVDLAYLDPSSARFMYVDSLEHKKWPDILKAYIKDEVARNKQSAISKEGKRRAQLRWQLRKEKEDHVQRERAKEASEFADEVIRSGGKTY